jgi:hypothetical protein
MIALRDFCARKPLAITRLLELSTFGAGVASYGRSSFVEGWY